MRTHRSTVVATGAAFAALGLVAAVPAVLGHRLGPAMTALGGGDPDWLVLAVAGFVAAFACTVAAWRAAFAAVGAWICPREAAARLGIGALVNSVAPAKLGDAVKVALCADALNGEGRLWTSGGVYAALGAARALALASLVVAASLTGALPLWPVFALCGLASVVAAGALASRRLRSHARIERLLAGMAALARSPRAAAVVIAWSLGVQLTRLVATVAVAASLGVPHPLLAGLVILPALDLAGTFPITPGGFGVGGGAVAVALASRGIGMTQALGVGIAIQALETIVSLACGAAGGMYLARLNPGVRRWTLRVAAVGASTGLAAVVGLVWLDLG